jgi:hypothetical protein
MRRRFRDEDLAYLSTASLGSAIGLIMACQKPMLTHKLVVTGNQHSVPLYSHIGGAVVAVSAWADEQTYLDVSREKQQGGVERMAGDVRSKLGTDSTGTCAIS